MRGRKRGGLGERKRGKEDLVTCRGELSAFRTLTENGLTLRSHMFSTSHNLEQEFFCYELTDFLSSRVFLRSCSFDFGQCKMQTADTGGKMQTEHCRPGVKWRLN